MLMLKLFGRKVHSAPQLRIDLTHDLDEQTWIQELF